MGTCCSRSTSDGIIVYPAGIKIPDQSEVGTERSNGDPRYTPDPNRPGTQLKRPGADIIRTPTTPLAIPRARTKSGDSRSSSFRERDSLQVHSGRVRTISGGSYSLNDMDTSQVDLPRAHLRSGEGGRSSVRQVELKGWKHSPYTVLFIINTVGQHYYNGMQSEDHPSPSRRIVVAVYNYSARERADVSFMKGDRMEVLDDTESDWWRVRHLRSGVEGLIPWNFVAEEKSVESEDWFFGKVLRKEAEKLLLSDENPRGTFLVRYSEHNPDGFSLSVKDWEETRGYHVKHYKIKPLDNGGYYIATNQTFATLQALVMAYTKNALGLCHVLACPCPKPKPHLWDLSPDMRDQWEIDRSEIHLIKKLGHGNFGEVWYGKWKNNIEVAVKTLRQGTMSTAAFLQEASIMKKFRHDRLVALYAVCSKEEPVYIVQEFMGNGSLLEFLRNGSGRKLMFGDLIYIAAQIASGMEYLEAKQLIHRDLAARNVLIGENNIAKICDFGLARVIEDDEYCPRQGSRFPVKWTAPEAIVYGRFSIKSDVWSYGILLMELFTYGQVPYPGMHGREVIEHVEKGYRMPNPSSHHIPEAIYRLMLNCWDADPEKRPTFEFLNHYFEDFTITSEMPYREVVD